MSDYRTTEDVYEQAIAAALGEGDMKAVEQLLMNMATWNPARAQAVVDTLNLGVAMRRRVSS